MADLISSFFSIYPVPQTFAEFIPYSAMLFIELMIVLAVFRMLGYLITGVFNIGRMRV